MLKPYLGTSRTFLLVAALSKSVQCSRTICGKVKGPFCVRNPHFFGKINLSKLFMKFVKNLYIQLVNEQINKKTNFEEKFRSYFQYLL